MQIDSMRLVPLELPGVSIMEVLKTEALYNPEIAPNLTMTKEEYKNSAAPTINHFYEKLLLLKDQMNTKTGQKIAVKRHRYMEQFLEQFYTEWDGLQ